MKTSVAVTAKEGVVVGMRSMPGSPYDGQPATPEGDDGASDRTLNHKESVMSNTELITCQEVLRLTGIRSRSTIWRKMRKGGFPHPVDIGGGR